ncbi:hypothetical protein IT157_00100 [bacterium]|nr:hypothetical protein [bacterium]
MKKLTLILVCAGAAISFAQPAATIGEISVPQGSKRVSKAADSFASELRSLKLYEPGEFLAGDGKTLLCAENILAKTDVKPFENRDDSGTDGIVRMWGDFLWEHGNRSAIAFPLDNGQSATWSDWADGLRPKKSGGRFIFTQVSGPSGSRDSFDEYLSFVAEEMGAMALRRETEPIVDDSIAIGDLFVALRNDKESWVGIVLDLCRTQKGERLVILGSCGTPSSVLYLPKPFSPVQGVGEWFTLDGARWEIGAGSKTELRRIRLRL